MSSPPTGPQPGADFGAQLKLLFDTVRPDPTDERRKHRRKRAYADVELADHVRKRTGKACSTNQVGLWKNGKSKPSIDQLEAIAEFFNVTPLHFFGDEKSVELKEQLSRLATLQQLVDSGEVTVQLREGSSTDPRELSALLLSAVHVWRQAPEHSARTEPAQPADDATD